MLRELRIRDLGVIAEAIVEFAPGLTALTGETGAGKTLIVHGVGLLLGERADLGVVRAGAERALIEGRWELTPEYLGLVRDVGGEAEDELLTSRQVGGRSRAMVGGAQVTLGTLAELVGAWATIHGQSGQIGLSDPNRQRELLDACANPGALADYRRHYALRKSLESELTQLRADAQLRASEEELLRFGLAEIDALAPEPGEDDALTAEAARLQAAEELQVLAAQAQAALSGGDDPMGEPGVVGLASQARKALEQAARFDTLAQPLVERLGELTYVAQDIAAEVSGYLADQVADPARLAAVMDRRADLARLTRKYGQTIAEVLTWAETARGRLTELQGSDERIVQLAAELAELDAVLSNEASAITSARAEAATKLAEQVRDELAALAMPHADLRFVLTPLPELGPHGAERVELVFSANPGSAPAPLAKVASGGELSRVRLALEVVLADATASQTFVFDEVDAGVGGAVGLEIGRRLQRLAQRCQVIVVTHLAQVAAFADHHLVVTKTSAGDVTSTGVVAVTGEARAAELSRMMAGLGDSAAGLKHANDLLAEAKRPTPSKRGS